MEVQGTMDDPWKLTTPAGSSPYQMYKDVKEGTGVIVCVVGKTVLYYDARCLAHLRQMLSEHGGWVELGGADEQKDAKKGTLEVWACSPRNPIGGWYGLKNGPRGRFAIDTAINGSIRHGRTNPQN